MSPQPIPTMTPEEEAAWVAGNRIVAAAPLFTHGSYGGYQNFGCRCEPCMEVWRDHARRQRERRRNRS